MGKLPGRQDEFLPRSARKHRLIVPHRKAQANARKKRTDTVIGAQGEIPVIAKPHRFRQNLQ